MVAWQDGSETGVVRAQSCFLRFRKSGCLCLAVLFMALSAHGGQVQKPPSVEISQPTPVYSLDPADPWNRIFCFLFSRRMEVRLSNEFPEGAPFTTAGVEVNLLRSGHQVSTRTFERNEVGDRAIDPLYPGSLDGAAARLLLTDPNYSRFTRALQDALQRNGPQSSDRSAVARALMQNDLWSAHDVLSVPFLSADETSLGTRRHVVVDLLARLIRKIALTPQEIEKLPANYPAAMRQYSLPELFNPTSGWIEVQWFPGRQHDFDAGYRRVSRVFLKPAADASTDPQKFDVQKFLDARIGRDATGLEAVALVMQLLVIDTHGKLTPTSITNDIRLIQYDHAAGGAFNKTDVRVWELSRALAARDPAAAGFVPQGDTYPAYAVENYKFANNYFETGIGQMHVGPPVQVQLRTRCMACHRDSNLTQIRTFAVALPPHPPPVRQLNPAAFEEAEFDIAAKAKQKDFLSLRAYFR